MGKVTILLGLSQGCIDRNSIKFGGIWADRRPLINSVLESRRLLSFETRPKAKFRTFYPL